MQVEPNEEDDVPGSGDGTIDATYGYYFVLSSLHSEFYFRFSTLIFLLH